jgi:PAS domain S-box-containing protein
MGIDANVASFPFLSGGGRLGELIAAFDWSATSLGAIANWSPTLRTSVALALHSAVPIVMLWGEDGVMIYNDAYAVFAGQRHPQLLGSKVLEGWPEVADFNANVMRVGLAGNTLAYRDTELTLHRNGVPEQVWMNLDYSPIPDETGKPVAVIAIVVETSAKVRAERWLAAESDRMRQMFEQAPGFMAMLSGPHHIFDLTNAAYMQLIGHRDVLGKTVREALPEVLDQGFLSLLDGVFSTGQPFIGRAMKVWLQRMPNAAREERFVDLIYQPVRDPTGTVVGIFVEGADVTERELASLAVRERENFFRTFAEAMPNHVWASPPDGQLDWFNSRVYEYSGAKAGELDGAGWATIVHPDDLQSAGERWMQSVSSGQPYETEFRLRRADGVYRWHIARAVALRDPEVRVSRWVGTNTDIDEQKRTAEALSASEARLRLAIEAGQLAVWESDSATGNLTPSPALNRLHGFPPDAQPSGDDYRSRYAPGEIERLGRIGAGAASRGESELDAEIRQLWPDGTERWLLIRAQWEKGTTRVTGVLLDVTDRKRSEQNLAESERRFRLSQNAAGIASLEVDVPTGTVVGSDGLWELWGLTPRDSVNIRVLEQIVLPEDQHIRSSAATRANGSSIPNVEYRIRRPDTGEIRWLSRHIEFTFDDAGKPLKMFGVMQDITEAKEAQSRQVVLTHELEHRIKNILAMVSAIASQTLRNTDLPTASAAFNDRLRALANAHDVLTRSRWTTASLSGVIESTLAHLPADRVEIAGPPVSLPPKAALSLALATNELATNALKYGALSNDDGTVSVQWSIALGIAGAQTLTWAWTESGGPPVATPARRGFGRFLIERVLATDVAGTVTIDYQPTGVVCTLVAPLPDTQPK